MDKSPAPLTDREIIDRAKLMLITRLSMTEPEAHRFIEKSAMDRCVKKRVVAEGILRVYDDGSPLSR